MVLTHSFDTVIIDFLESTSKFPSSDFKMRFYVKSTSKSIFVDVSSLKSLIHCESTTFFVRTFWIKRVSVECVKIF